jgi:predicted permease
MRDRVWTLVERRLRRALPSVHAASTLGDLAEDYARVRATCGPIRSRLWLVRESASLSRAYRADARVRRRRGFTPAADLRHAWRRIATRPAVPLLCVLLLSTAIGLATAMFSVVDSLLLKPAPFRDAPQLVQQGFWGPEPALLDAWRASGIFDAAEAVRPATFQHDSAATGAWAGAFVTAGTFDMLGVRPVHGRVFSPADARAGSDDVVVLSETIWRSAFGADREVLGRRIRLSGTPVIVVGIMPATFRFPAPASVVWQLFDPSRTTPRPVTIYGRLKAGVPWAEADARTAAMARQLARLPARYRGTPPFNAVNVNTLGEFTTRAIWLLLAGVALVFVVLCSNVISLLLAELAARRREFGVCSALGGSRARLIQQSAMEHALIAAAGAAGGIGLAWALTFSVPEFFMGRSLNVIDVYRRALAAACGLGMASAILAGLIPAWLGTRADAADVLRRSHQAATETRGMRSASRLLVVGEIALASALLVGSGLLVRSFHTLGNADRGLNTDGVVRVDLGRLDVAFPSPDAMALGTAAIQAQVEGWPDVSAVALSREVPPSLSFTESVQSDRQGSISEAGGVALQADRYRVGADFFAFYDIPILRGRAFAPGDSDSDVIVGERLAAALWPGADPLGRTFEIDRTRCWVIGVAGEIHLPTLQRDLDRPEFYLPLGKASRTLYLNLRCRGACPTETAMHARLAAIHPAITARIAPPLENEYLSHLRLPRALAELGELFAIVAVLTAAGGLFSVLTHAVCKRRREFGIRAALGASPRHMRRLVFRDGLEMVGGGAIAGVAGGWVVARALAGFHYGVTASDPLTWAAVIGTIALTSLAAVWRPARQATRVDPVQLLRED